MHESLAEISLKGGETVAVSRIKGPDAEWAERIEALMGHKGEEWRWQISRCARDDLGIDSARTRFADVSVWERK